MKRWLLTIPLLLVCGGPGGPVSANSAHPVCVNRMPSQAQDAPDPEIEAKVTKFLDLAIGGRISIRTQAARRLVKMGEPARVRVLAACGENGEKLADLGPYLIEALAGFEDDVLRSYLWKGLADLDFPWRGPAARGLAKSPMPVELLSLIALCRDRLDQVRLAAIESLDRFDPTFLKSQDAVTRALLHTIVREDQSDRVRRAAALRLDTQGEPGYLLWLVEDLQRTDKYFRLPLGEQARFAANRALEKRLGQDFGFRAEDAPDSEGNVKALAAIRAAVMARIEGEAPVVPEALLAASETQGDVIGLELRSCRVGEFFLRWNEEDVLYVGTGKGVPVPLEPGTVARLKSDLAQLTAALGETRFWGEVGCDLEQLRLVNSEGAIDAFLISKGQAKVPDLRPTALDAAVALLVASIPTPEHAELASGVREALELLGGEF
jgi:hypothetical protein